MKKYIKLDNILLFLSLVFASIYALFAKNYLVGLIDGITFPCIIFLIIGSFLYLENKGVFNAFSYSADRMHASMFSKDKLTRVTYLQYTNDKNRRLANKKNPLIKVGCIELLILLALLTLYYIL